MLWCFKNLFFQMFLSLSKNENYKIYPKLLPFQLRKHKHFQLE